MNKVTSIIEKYKNDLHLAELFKGGGISFLLKIVGLALGYIFSIVVARTLGAESWGIYSICLAIVTISSIFARFGFDTTILRLNAEYKATNKEQYLISLSKFVFKISFLISLFISLIVFLFASFISAQIFGKPELTESVRLISLAIIPFSLSLIVSSALKGLKKITKAVFIEYVSKFALMLFLFLMWIFFFDLTIFSIVYIIVIASWLMFIISGYWYWRVINSSNFSTETTIDWKPIFKIAMPLIMASSVFYIKGWIDTISIGIFMTEKDVGIYNIAYKLAHLTLIPLLTINSIASPKFAENIKNKIELKVILRKAVKLISLFSFPILISLILFPKLLLGVFGNEFIEAEIILIIIAIAAFINSVFGSFGYLLQMTGRHIEFQNSIIILVLAASILNYFFIPSWGLMGAAISTLVVNLLWNTSIIIYNFI